MWMRPPPDNHTFANAAEMRAHYAAVHKRIYGEISKKPRKVIGKSIVWKGVQVEAIISLVANFYRISAIDIRKSKTQSVVRIRYVVMYLAYRVARKPLRNIGNAMGFTLNTVHEGARKIQDRRLHDAVLNSEINALTLEIEKKKNV